MAAGLDRIVRGVVAPAAAAVDRDGTFPRASVTALGGLLGMTMSRAVGGRGCGLAEASDVVERVAAACGSTGVVLRSHFAAVAALDRLGDRALRSTVAAGGHLSTVAVFTPGSHFLLPAGTASRRGDVVDLRDRKSGVVAAGEADSYVWSSAPLAAHGTTTLWLVPANAPGLLVPVDRPGIGLRGTVSTTVWADPAHVPVDCLLGADGQSFDTVVHHVLPWYVVLGASVALGIMSGAIDAVAQYLATADLLRLRLRADAVRVLHTDAVAAVDWEPDRARRKLCQLAVHAAEALATVTDLALKASADTPAPTRTTVERHFREARSLNTHPPTADAFTEFTARAEPDHPRRPGSARDQPTSDRPRSTTPSLTRPSADHWIH
ncbi:acyl-CoA dehydrogenase family protein [Saccharothrix sp. NRRL B-16348]|uniref:acyl-CoA dehydrogenase family protein n=1 Tax=Saccharothrix sp. NRRL B-16348 TaxID=1415542 RepID=UPI0006AED57D|nr:acyl-CoA dehydrogenase family protein [Saccharothrix sp. NRRL B-16348]